MYPLAPIFVVVHLLLQNGVEKRWKVLPAFFCGKLQKLGLQYFDDTPSQKICCSMDHPQQHTIVPNPAS